jgi:hypothetical protein
MIWVSGYKLASAVSNRWLGLIVAGSMYPSTTRTYSKNVKHK